MNKPCCGLGICLWLSLACPAAAEPVHVVVPSTVTTESGAKLALQPAWILTEPDYAKIDAALRQLQNERTSLRAQNVDLRASLEAETPVWKIVLISAASALAVGLTVGTVAALYAPHPTIGVLSTP